MDRDDLSGAVNHPVNSDSRADPLLHDWQAGHLEKFNPPDMIFAIIASLARKVELILLIHSRMREFLIFFH